MVLEKFPLKYLLFLNKIFNCILERKNNFFVRQLIPLNIYLLFVTYFLLFIVYLYKERGLKDQSVKDEISII